MVHSVSLVTGATSGVGYAAARALAVEGRRQVIVTGRNLAKVQETADRLAAETRSAAFTPMELNLNEPTSVKSAVEQLVQLGLSIDFLLLNAGWIGGKERILTPAGVEETQAPLIGHHQLTVGLLRANLPTSNVRIVMAGSEAARGDVPMFAYTDVAALAAARYHGDRSAAVETVLRGRPEVKFAPNQAHADVKVFVAWWAAALSRRLPAGMAVYAVSPGSTPDTQGLRNAGPTLRWLMLPLMRLMPGMSHTPDAAAHRYLAALQFGTDVSGQFFASPPGKFTGPIEAMRQPHLLDRASQEAAWIAIAKVSGVDLPQLERAQSQLIEIER